MKKLFVIILSFCLFGCMATPSANDLANANFGNKPISYEENIKNVIGAGLKDPFSAQYKFGEPKKGYYQEGPSENFLLRYGWIIPVQVNAKNSYGAYVGFKNKYFMISEEKLYDITLKYETGYAKLL